MRFIRAPNASEGSIRNEPRSSESSNRGPSGSLGSNPRTPTIFQESQIWFRPVSVFLFCCLLYGIVGSIRAQQTPPAAPTEPSPKLTPAQVVSAQLAALKNNDDRDSGIRISFRFASPGNKAQTGPIERFIAMVKNPAYLPMINHQSVHPEPIEVNGSAARQIVTLVASHGKRTRYLFVLSKQKQPPCRGCWMTDAVVRLDSMSGPVKVASDNAPDCRSGLAHAFLRAVSLFVATSQRGGWTTASKRNEAMTGPILFHPAGSLDTAGKVMDRSG